MQDLYYQLITYIYWLGTFKCSYLSSLGIHSYNERGTGDVIKQVIIDFMITNKMVERIGHGEYHTKTLDYASSEFLSVFHKIDKTVSIPNKITDTYNALLEEVRRICIEKRIVQKRMKCIYSLLVGVLIRKDVLNHKTKIINTPIKPGKGGSRFELSVAYVLDNLGIRYVREKRVKDFDCYDKENDSDIGLCRYDFYLPDYNILIETDGIQHFQSVKRFGGSPQFRKTRESDRRKDLFAYRNNIQLVRLDIRENRSMQAIEKNLESIFNCLV